MPRKKSSAKAIEETPVPTRAGYLADNPYSDLTLDVAETLLATKTTALMALEADVADLKRVVLSFHMVWMDNSGVVHKVV